MNSNSPEVGTWRSAVDPGSGRTYFYNDVTKKTQWDKPVSFMKGEELAEYNRAKKEREEFFKEMERNVLNRMAGIYIAQSKVIEINDDDDGLDDTEQSPPLRTRTISTIDDEIFSYIRKRENSTGDAKVTRDDFYKSAEGKNSERSFESLHEQYKNADHEFLSSSGRGSISSSGSGGKSSPKSPGRPPKLVRRNSTNTIFVNSTLSSQDNNATITCIAHVIRSHIVTAQKRNAPMTRRYEIFLDAAYQDNASEIVARGASPRASPKSLASSPSLARSKSPFDGSELKSGNEDENDYIPVPKRHEVETFFRQIFDQSQLEGECIIMSLIYCEKLIKATKGKMCISVYNWKSILFACLVMSSKVWDDLSMWNCDFSSICPSFDLHRVNDLELEMLDILKYQIKVSASEYAKYYFHLRSMMMKLGLTGSLRDSGFAKPLDLAGAKCLQLATERLAEQAVTGSGRGGASGAGSTSRDGGGSGGDGDREGGGDGGRVRSRTTAPMPAPLDRAVSNEGVGGTSSGAVGTTHTAFIGIEQLMHDRHTDADGQVHKAHQTEATAGGSNASRK